MSQVLATSTSLVQEKADHSAVYILAVDRAKESPSLKVENHGDRYMEAKRSRVGRQLKRWMTTRLARESTGPANQAGSKGTRESNGIREQLLQLSSRGRRESTVYRSWKRDLLYGGVWGCWNSGC